MTDTIIPYELAKYAKSLGFSEPCLYWYADSELVSEDEILYHIRNGSGLFYDYNAADIQDITVNSENEKVIPTSAPTHQQVIDWLRIKHNIRIMPEYLPDHFSCYRYTLMVRDEKKGVPCVFSNYYDFLNHAIDQCFDLI